MTFQFSELTGELGLKAIAFDYNKNVFVSPAKSDFIWSPEGLVAAECTKCTDIPGDECSCGIYAAFRWDIAFPYTGVSIVSPMLLVEAAGKVCCYPDVFRAKQCLVRAVILDGSRGVDRMVVAQAADFFKTTVLTKQVAILAMDMWNWYLNPWYVPNDGQLLKIGREKSIEKLSQYLDVKPKGEMAWQVSPQSQESM